MTARQRIVLRIGLALALLLTIFPPWRTRVLLTGTGGASEDYYQEHRFVLTASLTDPQGNPNVRFYIDVGQFLAELSIIGFATALAYVQFSGATPSQPAKR